MFRIPRISLAFIAALLAVPCWGEQPSKTDADDSSRYELIVEHARTNMELAEVELQVALETNKKTGYMVIPNLVIERLRSNLTVAEERYNEAKLASVGGLDRVRRRHAEEKIRLAKIALENGKVSWKESMVSDLELKRLELKYDLAKLNLALIDNPEKFVTLLYYLEAKLNNLSEEILTLDQRISDVEPLR